MDVEAQFLAQAKVMIASFLGGMVRLFLRPSTTLLRSIGLVACCVTLGFYFTPMAMDYFNLPEEWIGGVGALIGLVGLSVADALVHFNYSKIADHWLNRGAPKEGNESDQKQVGS